MKKIICCLWVIIVTAIVTTIFTQCNTVDNSESDYVWEPQMGSYVADSRAIDTLVMNGNWSESAYRSISNNIQWDYYHSRIDSVEKVYKLYQKLLDKSSNYSYRKVDSLLQLPTVDEQELTKYRKMNKFLLDDYKAKGKVDSSIANKAKRVNQSQELIDAYDRVKSQCNWTFTQPVSSTLPFARYDRVSAADHEQRIKNNKFWKSHFHNNISFNNSFPQFPQRRDNAKSRYYTETVKEFSKDVLTEGNPYSLEENIQFYVSLVRNIKDDLGNGSVQADDATKAIVDYFKYAYNHDASLSTDEKIRIGNNLCSQIESLVGKNKDNGLADFILTL